MTAFRFFGPFIGWSVFEGELALSEQEAVDVRYGLRNIAETAVMPRPNERVVHT